MAAKSSIFHVLTGMAVLAFHPICHAQISLDGTTLCPDTQLCEPADIPTVLTGPDYLIGHDMGKTMGPNLIHSFHEFNIAQGESATFTGPNTIANIISRVTGGNTSNINGLLKSEIAGANFFLINPAGVIFGAGAQLNIDGSFAVTTADQLHLGDGGVLAASVDPANSVLVSASPSAFGFLDGQSLEKTGVEVNGAILKVDPGQSITIVADDGQDINEQTVAGIVIDGGTLNVSSGKVSLVSVTSPGEVTYDTTTHVADLDIASFEQLGTVQIVDGAHIDVSGDLSGTVAIRGGQLQITGSSIMARNDENAPESGIDINIAGHTILNSGQIESRISDVSIYSEQLTLENGSTVMTSTIGDSAGGSIALHVTGDIEITGTTSHSIIKTQTAGSGKGGDISVTADTVTLLARGAIRAETISNGNGGGINITANRLMISGAGAGNVPPLFVFPLQTGPLLTDIREVLFGVETAYISTLAAATGNAGHVDINVTDRIDILESGLISANTLGPGNGGNLDITASTIFGARGPGGLITGVSVATLQFLPGGGTAGNIHIKADTFQWMRGAILSADTFGSGNGGTALIEADHVLLDGQGTDRFTGFTVNSILALPFGSITGDGGTLTVRTNELTMLGADFSAISTGNGKGGQINVFVSDKMLLDGDGIFSSISATAFGTGAGGNIFVDAQDIELINQGLIVAAAFGPADAGNVDVIAKNILIDGGGVPFTIGGGFIITGIGAEAFGDQNVGGQGGDIHVQTDSLRIMGEGVISAVATGLGIGGNITIDTFTLNISNSGSIDSTSIGLGNAGDINVNAKNAVLLDSNGSVATSADFSNGGDIEITAGDKINIFDSTISAAAALDGGNIKLTAPTWVRIVRSTITGQAGQDGGQIAIDPIFVILDQSTINGLAGGLPVFVTIDPNAILLSSQSQILTTSVSLPPELDLSGSLAQLPESLLNDVSQLSETCAIKLEGEFSSFIVVGRGGVPVEPGSALPSFQITTSPRDTQKPQ